jgi:hypothetical protein
MRLMTAGIAFVALGFGGFLLYVNYFGETGRDGGDVVKAGSWLSVAIGVAFLLASTAIGRGVRRLVARAASRSTE